MNEDELKDCYKQMHYIHKKYYSSMSIGEFLNVFARWCEKHNKPISVLSNQEFMEELGAYVIDTNDVFFIKDEEDNNMDKNTVYKKVFNLVKEAVDWGMEDGEKEFVNYVAGVVELADELLDEDKRANTNNME